jgi:hypothetical protein
MLQQPRQTKSGVSWDVSLTSNFSSSSSFLLLFNSGFHPLLLYLCLKINFCLRKEMNFLTLKYTCTVDFLFTECLAIIILYCSVFSYLHRSLHEMSLAVSQASASPFTLCSKKKKILKERERTKKILQATKCIP